MSNQFLPSMLLSRPSTAKRSYDETHLSILAEVGEKTCRHLRPVLSPNKKARVDVEPEGAKESAVNTEWNGNGDEASESPVKELLCGAGAQELSVENNSAQGNISSSPDASSDGGDMASSESLSPCPPQEHNQPTSNPSQSLLGRPLLPRINTEMHVELPVSPDSNCSSPRRKTYVPLHVNNPKTLPPLQKSKLAERALMTPLSSPLYPVSHKAITSLPISEATASIYGEKHTSETDGSSRSDTEDHTRGNMGSSQIADHCKKARPVQASRMYDNNSQYSQALPPRYYSPPSATPTISDFIQSIQQYAANNTHHKSPTPLRPKLDHVSINHSYASPASPQEEVIVQLRPTPGSPGKHYPANSPRCLIFSRDGFPISR